MLQQEIEFLCSLKKNSPEVELTGGEKRQVGNIYYKYFGSMPISDKLIANELANKWPGGERKKAHECQRCILESLQIINAIAPADGQLILPKVTLDLTYVMGVLRDALPNNIILLEMCTWVAMEVPVASKDVEFAINGRPFSLEAGAQLTREEIICYAFGGEAAKNDMYKDARVSVAANKDTEFVPFPPNQILTVTDGIIINCTATTPGSN